ncbi:hypothetical protein MZD04_gp391 [Pseudomonas phage Psa21]|uniref:Uncharacterized protein n=1 Tax=Pseudomonas phage Psa21 TaxID=2530023 RepID=A0A481W6S0_9CAUD|nr:hypothetical protein MZD04_gp391 [Pseudomonas phage Psa21]QBJ02917.1 hypothetical protein PSA21_391 [Pseudomonas phage Psa21]
MELENTEMYTLEIKDLAADESEVQTVTKAGWELMQEFNFLQIGQVVRDWKMFIVTPLIMG